MKSIFSSLVVSIFIVFFLSPLMTFAETVGSIPVPGSIPAPGSVPVAVSSLRLVSIAVQDDAHVDITFSLPVSLDTLKLKIVKQSDASSLKILSLSGSEEDPSVTHITLDTVLLPGTAYTLTVVSAVGNDGSVIRDGALALKDFVTPTPLPVYVAILSAAPNPNAVLVKTGSEIAQPVITTQEAQKAPLPVVEKKEVKTEIKELPLTGMNPLFLLIVIFPLVFFILRARKA